MSVLNRRAGSSNSILLSGCGRCLAGHRPTLENSSRSGGEGRAGVRNPPNSWMSSLRKTASSKLLETLKQEVSTKTFVLIASALKACYVQSPRQKPQFNYGADVYGKWYEGC